MRPVTLARMLPAALLAGLAATPLGAQDLSAVLDRRADQVPDGKRAFQETWLLPRSGAVAADASGTEFGGRVSVFQEEGRERLEIRPVRGGALADPIVVIGDGDEYWLATAVGTTSLAGSEPGRDRFVLLVLEGPAGNAPPHRTVPADGGIAAVVLRAAMSADFDEDDAFDTRRAPLASDRLGGGISAFSAGGDREAVAAAGARGVERVPTPDGEVAVTPDPAAIDWMETQAASPMETEAFKREGRLAPYDALPPAEAAPADSTPGAGA